MYLVIGKCRMSIRHPTSVVPTSRIDGVLREFYETANVPSSKSIFDSDNNILPGFDRYVQPALMDTGYIVDIVERLEVDGFEAVGSSNGQVDVSCIECHLNCHGPLSVG